MRPKPADMPTRVAAACAVMRSKLEPATHPCALFSLATMVGDDVAVFIFQSRGLLADDLMRILRRNTAEVRQHIPVGIRIVVSMTNPALGKAGLRAELAAFQLGGLEAVGEYMRVGAQIILILCVVAGNHMRVGA